MSEYFDVLKDLLIEINQSSLQVPMELKKEIAILLSTNLEFINELKFYYIHLHVDGMSSESYLYSKLPFKKQIPVNYWEREETLGVVSESIWNKETENFEPGWETYRKEINEFGGFLSKNYETIEEAKIEFELVLEKYGYVKLKDPNYQSPTE